MKSKITDRKIKSDLLEAYKQNCMRIALHHKEHCSGETCHINLYLLAMMLEQLGVKLNSKERGIFI